MAVPAVSVPLIVYNQENIVERALVSIAAQEVDFDVEVVIADDASTDGTLAVIERWRDRLPLRILPPQPNLGITRNYQRALAACEGALIAPLAGDDEWNDDQRLRKLKAVMDADLGLAMCGNRILLIEDETGAETALPADLVAPERVTDEDLAHGSRFSTVSACMYRASMVRRINPAVFDTTSYDWMLSMSICEHGDGLLLPDVMTGYHRHAGGGWSGLDEEQQTQKLRDLLPAYIQLLRPRMGELLQEHLDNLLAGRPF